ncbi:histidine phosphatase family protein [Caenimonas koreensis]|uniref:Histidine phosphatase family protein n=1 Tax=Caenimonas koreensis DSM 17982 TaxID=1121255 RepID=A0A844AZX1_9BURK|nr:histidine phosphatase family protein [Caenimonas koreensis]MRD47988.1 hypothetical protein [Caenimonas koreensis DSM 17982]
MRVLLVRHAEPLSAGRLDHELAPSDEENALSDEGQRQSQALGRMLEAGDFDRAEFHCSPIRRAQDTFLIATKDRGRIACIDSRLAELRLNMVPMRTMAQVRAEQIEAYMAPESSVHSSESVVDHKARVSQFFDEVINPRRQDSRTLVIVAHGGTIEHLLGCFIGSLPSALTSYFTAMPCCAYHELANVAPVPGRCVWRLDRVSALVR